MSISRWSPSRHYTEAMHCSNTSGYWTVVIGCTSADSYWNKWHFNSLWSIIENEWPICVQKYSGSIKFWVLQLLSHTRNIQLVNGVSTWVPAGGGEGARVGRSPPGKSPNIFFAIKIVYDILYIYWSWDWSIAFLLLFLQMGDFLLRFSHYGGLCATF